MILSVDPGKHHHGCALWENEELAAAWVTDKDVPLIYTLPTRADVIDRIVIEGQRIRPLKESKGGLKGQNDMLDVAWAAGEAVGPFVAKGVRVTRWKPEEWKGSVPKKIMMERILSVLSEDEKERIRWHSAKLDHNIIDGIGLGLRYLRREYGR